MLNRPQPQTPSLSSHPMSQRTLEPTREPASETGPEPAAEQPSKHQMIEAIRKRNRSAQPEFLSSFDENTLASYLQRLTHLADRRGRESVWVRDSTSRAVVTRIPH